MVCTVRGIPNVVRGYMACALRQYAIDRDAQVDEVISGRLQKG